MNEKKRAQIRPSGTYFSAISINEMREKIDKVLDLAEDYRRINLEGIGNDLMVVCHELLHRLDAQEEEK